MKTLVTGATGFLGSHLCRRLVGEGHEVAALCRPASNAERLAGLPVEILTGDVTDAASVARAVAGRDLVFHAAAHIAYWSRQKDLQNRTNVEGTRAVVEACRQAGTPRLVHVSSVAAVGLPASAARPADENFAFNLEGSPLNYHISKKRTEEIVRAAADDGLEAVIVNPSTIWGPHGRQFRGAEIARSVRDKRFVPYFTGGISVVHVEDVVEGLLAAAARGRRGERYILGGENLSFKEMAEAAARAQNLERSFVPLPNAVTWLAAAVLESVSVVTRRRPPISFVTHYGASRFHYYDSTKARRELGFAPRPFADIMRECVAFLDADRIGAGETN